MDLTTITTLTDMPVYKAPSSSQLSDLTHISNLLHLLHHRNHNQHRRSTWYRHFNLFRRHLSALLVSITELQRIPDTHLARHRKKAKDKETELSIRQRLGFWRDVLVPKSQHAFGQLTADGRFAVLGIMLLASLSSVCRIVGLLGVYEELGQQEVQKVLEEFAKERWGEDEGLGVLIPREDARAGAEDLGEVLRRDADEEEEARDTEMKLKARESACLAPEQEVLRQSREALREMSAKASASVSASASPAPQDLPDKKTVKTLKRVGKDKTERSGAPSPVSRAPSAVPLSRDMTPASETSAKTKTKLKTKRPKEDEASSASKPKKKRKKNAIDELFGGL